MNIQIYPCDTEAVGSLRILYPYQQLEQNLGWPVICELAGRNAAGKLLTQVPEAALGGKPSAYSEKFLQQTDVFVIQRPLDLVYAPFAAWLRENGKKVVVDIDDWVQAIPSRNMGAKAIQRSKHHSAEVVTHTLRYADLLTVTTEKLAYLYRPFTDAEIVVLPNMLRREDWAHIQPAYGKDRGLIRVGWQGWLQYRGNDLRVLKKVLPKWLKAHPEVIFVNVGKPDALDYLRLGVNTMHFQGQIFPRHAVPVSEIDIGLVPLVHNDFNECKSSLKGMEYAACGAACIATSTEPYRQWVDHGVNGFLCDKPSDWLDALDAMIEGGRWRDMGLHAHQKIQSHWVEDRWTDWGDVLHRKFAGSSMAATRFTKNGTLPNSR